jgi:hypothetical protein
LIAENVSAKGVHGVLTDQGVYFASGERVVFTPWPKVVLRGNDTLWLVIQEPYQHFETITLLPDPISKESKDAFKRRALHFPCEVLPVQIARIKENIETMRRNGTSVKIVSRDEKLVQKMEKTLVKCNLKAGK